MKRKTGKIAAAGLLGLVILFHLLTAVLNGTGLGNRIGWFPLSYLTVESGSMEPVISRGDLLVAWETPWEELEPGDIITFHQGNDLVTHELIRKEENCVITKGKANQKEDESVKKQDYCAKIVAIIPNLGYILEYLDRPATLICAIILLTAVFYGKAWTEYLLAAADGKRKSFRRGSLLKLLSLLAAVSFLTVTPFMTAAKYVASINARTGVSAGELSLSSSCLSKEGNIYNILNWAGGGYGLTVKIRNYENQLIVNPAGTDVTYSLYGEQVASDGEDSYNTDYTMEMAPLTSVTAASTEGFAAPAALAELQCFGTWTLPGGSSISDAFAFQLSMDADAQLTDGDQIRFRLYAATPADHDFEVILTGDYLLTYSTAGSFIEEAEIGGEENSSLVNFTIHTRLVAGGGTRNVKVKWLPAEVYLNETELTAAGVIASQPENYHPEADTDGYAYLILLLQPYSEASLQFFKYDVTLAAPDIRAIDMTEQE